MDVKEGGTVIIYGDNIENGGLKIETRYGAAEKEATSKSKKQPLTKETIKKYIDALIPQINQQNHWFAIFKPLVWVHVLDANDYEGAVRYIHSLYPNKLKVDFTSDDIRKLDVFSLSKELKDWKETDSPIHGQRYYNLKGLATAFFEMLNQHRPAENKE